jgi:hypothetical protein
MSRHYFDAELTMTASVDFSLPEPGVRTKEWVYDLEGSKHFCSIEGLEPPGEYRIYPFNQELDLTGLEGKLISLWAGKTVAEGLVIRSKRSGQPRP